MQKSMTGFGRGEVVLGAKRFKAEVRSLNSKQLDLAVKMPPIYRMAEFEIRNMAAKELVRGKVDISISCESSDSQVAAHIDKEAFKQYLTQVSDALCYSGIDAAYDVLVPAILKMPAVLSNEQTDASDEELAAVQQAAALAMASLDDFRKQEGKTLIADLVGRVDKIESLYDEIAPFEAARTESIRQRIRENIAKLGIEVDENRLEQEMIYYIEKLDITEERVRLHNHCKYFREVAANEPQAGRKLGFIAQEMGREINTTGSKANNHDIQTLVVQMKDELEKIKEQVLNLL